MCVTVDPHAYVGHATHASKQTSWLEQGSSSSSWSQLLISGRPPKCGRLRYSLAFTVVV